MNAFVPKVALTLMALPLALGLSSSASAQLFHKKTATTRKHHGLLHRTAVGVGAYEVAKHTGNRRAAHGGKRNILQRHPILTGLGAAHVAKHH